MRGPRGGVRRNWRLAAIVLFAAGASWLLLAVAASGARAVRSLEEDPSSAPVEVLAAPAVLRPGEPLDIADLEAALIRSGYRKVADPELDPGEFRRSGRTLELHRRPYDGPRGPVRAADIVIRAGGGRLRDLKDGEGRRLRAFTCEPEVLGRFHGSVLEDRQPRPLDEFPRDLVAAVLAAEDARFMRHPGVDAKAVARAAWAALRRRGTLQGGSTITQQVIKNRLVGRERTVLRKVREATLALWIEGRVPKRRILEIYLNEIYLGQVGSVSVVGMPAAARHWFGKDVADVDLHEAALLAGMIASPGRFDPRREPEIARRRRDWVLTRMAQLEFIDQARGDAAKERPLETTGAPHEDSSGDLLDAVQRELERRGWPPRPASRTVRVFTSIDAEVQRAAASALEETLAELEAQRPKRAPLEGAVVVLRPASGEIVALVGGRSRLRGGFHRAIDARRQPGSVFKPFVALAAFANGEWTPSRLVDDEPFTIDTPEGPWSPRNIDGEFRGPVSLREALEKSLNVPFARIGLEIGPERIVRSARASGVEGRLARIPSIALGTGEVTPLSLANGFATIASLGVRRSPFVVRDVAAPDQPATIALSGLEPAQAVIPAAEAFMVLDAMAGVTLRGTGRGLMPALDGRVVATKTGTTQDGRDAWFAMISGDSVVVVWIGRDDARPAQLSGSGAALPVVRRLVERVGGSLLAPLPRPPEGVVIARIDPETGGVANWRCPSAVDELFLEGQLPPKCDEHAGLWRRLWGRRDRTERRP